LAVHAHLQWGLSRDQASQLLCAQQHILRLALAPTFTPSRSWNPTYDIRTAIKHLNIDPIIVRSVCCPACFRQYSTDDFPVRCDWKELGRCRKVCGEPLTMQRWTQSQGCVTVPRRLYSLQSFDDWIQWFLQRPGVEELLERSWLHRPATAGMRTLWDTPLWQENLAPYSLTPGNLVLGLFYDSFNPLHNKIAGKVVSCGVIIAVILNLPHELWRQPGNFYLVGMTPPPGGPSPVTITALLDPVVDMLQPYASGQLVQTNLHPEGRSIAVRLIPTIMDKLAAHKANGFGSHSCTYFCPNCLCTLDQLEQLDIENWTLRTSDAVREAAAEWTSAQTLTKRKALFKSSGIRGSALHRLTYRDHVQHNTIGVMHNILEGVLQHHFRRKWGFADSIPASNSDDLSGSAIPNAEDMEIDEDAAQAARHAQEQRELDSELDHLRLELVNRSEEASSNARYRAVNVSTLTLSVSDHSSDPDYIPEAENSDDSDDSDGSDWEEQSDVPRPAFGARQTRTALIPTFDPTEVAQIRVALGEMIWPTWFDPPPPDIGAKRHGKLKAIQWLNLFARCLPLDLVERWTTSPSPRQQNLLENFCNLVSSVNIVTSYESTEAGADSYLAHFVAYRRSVRELWPEQHSVPNHHYAMHLAAQMKLWGPPMLLSEFPFESAIGEVQDINTNNHYADMDLTMLRRMCQKQRFLVGILHADSHLLEERLENGPAATLREGHRHLEQLPTFEYDSILALLSAKQEPHQHHRQLTYQDNIPVLTRQARPLKNVVVHGRKYGVRTVHEGNSLIWCRVQPGHTGVGFISSLWAVEVNGMDRIFGVLSCLDRVPEAADPFSAYPLLECRIYEDRDTERREVFEAADIISHLGARRRPVGTFGIESNVLVMCNLNQSRIPQ
ncbi:hypothetical protein BKA62DRAFT_628105, partial [Auriculariales sp. MPI-PUGE-AT-0066]